jgi:hypothetical protein
LYFQIATQVTLEKQKIDEFEDGVNCIVSVPKLEERDFILRVDMNKMSNTSEQWCEK